MLSSTQLKAARSLLEWNQRTLAKAVGVSLPTIQRMEASQRNVRGDMDTLVKVLDAFERGGVEFIAQDVARPSGRRGVRLK